MLLRQPQWPVCHCVLDCPPPAGYTFNISLLRKIFAPQFIMHDMKRTGDYEITSRWTMIMQFTLNRYSPLQRWWDPQLIFTGVSIMGVNRENGEQPSYHSARTCSPGKPWGWPFLFSRTVQSIA